jgi:hypothetical protein
MKQLTILLIFMAGSVFGQNCDCKKDLGFLIQKVEKDYPGFTDKVNKNTRADYEAFTRKMVDKAAHTGTFNRCTDLLEEWLGFFQDKHLRLRGIQSNHYWTYKKLSDQTVMLRLPSFDYDDKVLIDSLVGNNLKEITSTPNLIIDLRSNGGGTDFSFDTLMPLIYSQPYYSDAVEYYASDGNIRSLEESLAAGDVRKGGEEWLNKLVKLMKEHRGEFVMVDPPDTVRQDTVYKFPRKVGLIADDFCASSCEQFILDSKHSTKVTVFGCNTYGVLDYSNTSPEPFPDQEGLFVWMPKTRSTRLPEHPVDNIGIPPDVVINLPYNMNPRDEADDWVIFVKDYLEKK